MNAGDPGMPLAQRLGLAPGTRAWFLNMPEALRAAIDRYAPPFELLAEPEPPVDLAHVFVSHCAALDCELRMLLPLLAQDGMIWVSWPSNASGATTDISEEVIRKLAHPLHLVDLETCRLDENWSGMKLAVAGDPRAGQPGDG